MTYERSYIEKTNSKRDNAPPKKYIYIFIRIIMIVLLTHFKCFVSHHMFTNKIYCTTILTTTKAKIQNHALKCVLIQNLSFCSFMDFFLNPLTYWDNFRIWVNYDEWRFLTSGPIRVACYTLIRNFLKSWNHIFSVMIWGHLRFLHHLKMRSDQIDPAWLNQKSCEKRAKLVRSIQSRKNKHLTKTQTGRNKVSVHVSEFKGIKKFYDII